LTSWNFSVEYQEKKQEVHNLKQPVRKILIEYAVITFATLLLVAGVYLFKFPNNFSFGGVTGIAVILSGVVPVSAPVLTNGINIALLAVGFLFLGRSFGVKTVYVTAVNTLAMWLLDRYYPMDAPLTTQPVLELVFAIVMPALSAAILFNMDASSGGTDIVAMVLRKYTSLDIGVALMLVDALVVVASFVIYGPETGLFSATGLFAKTLVIDGAIENINLCKFFTIISDDPEPIVRYIHEELNRSATLCHAEGTYLHRDKTVILTVTKRRQAVQLRNYVKKVEPGAFLMITNSSEIIGKGFRGFN
jgi:uncharacterized membrane-anchored protein YitT (DUF2179 family)